MVALEFTNRPGVPSSSYEFCVATKNFGEVIELAPGADNITIRNCEFIGPATAVRFQGA